MDELKLKIEELLKGLFAVKQQQDHFVPTPKATSVSTPSVTGLQNTIKPPAATNALGDLSNFSVPKAAAPKPLPGGTGPASQKDPAKMAEQLRNPHPTKPQTEVLKVERNGQWSLVKEEQAPALPHLPVVRPKGIPASSPVGGSTQPGKITPAQHVAMNTPPAPTPVEMTKPTNSARARRQAVLNAPISAKEHGWSTHSPDQHSLIDGLALHEAKPINKGAQGAAFANSGLHPHTSIVKNSAHHEDRELRGHTRNNFNSARREVLYHDLAHKFFGMGDHVPTTAGFTHKGDDWSAQKKVDGASHVMHSVDGNNRLRMQNPNHERVIGALNDSGHLDKLAIMDHLMGHHDRHANNFLVNDKGDGLHLIDNGTAFDYGNYDMHPTPRYRKYAKDMAEEGRVQHNGSLDVHPEALNWLYSLKPDDAKQMFAAHGHDENSPAVQGFMGRLEHLHDALDRSHEYDSIDDILEEGKDFTHQGEQPE